MTVVNVKPVKTHQQAISASEVQSINEFDARRAAYFQHPQSIPSEPKRGCITNDPIRFSRAHTILGSIQIICGILFFIITPILFTKTTLGPLTGILALGALMYILAGSFGIAGRNKKRCALITCLVFSILAAIVSALVMAGCGPGIAAIHHGGMGMVNLEHDVERHRQMPEEEHVKMEKGMHELLMAKASSLMKKAFENVNKIKEDLLKSGIKPENLEAHFQIQVKANGVVNTKKLEEYYKELIQMKAKMMELNKQLMNPEKMKEFYGKLNTMTADIVQIATGEKPDEFDIKQIMEIKQKVEELVKTGMKPEQMKKFYDEMRKKAEEFGIGRHLLGSEPENRPPPPPFEQREPPKGRKHDENWDDDNDGWKEGMKGRKPDEKKREHWDDDKDALLEFIVAIVHSVYCCKATCCLTRVEQNPIIVYVNGPPPAGARNAYFLPPLDDEKVTGMENVYPILSTATAPLPPIGWQPPAYETITVDEIKTPLE